MAAAGYLIWVQNPNGPQPQKWAEPPPAIASDYWKHRVLATVPLSAEDFAQPLDYLAMKYPAPEVVETEAKTVIDHALMDD